jgi:hypothetical protein
LQGDVVKVPEPQKHWRPIFGSHWMTLSFTVFSVTWMGQYKMIIGV